MPELAKVILVEFEDDFLNIENIRKKKLDEIIPELAKIILVESEDDFLNFNIFLKYLQKLYNLAELTIRNSAFVESQDWLELLCQFLKLTQMQKKLFSKYIRSLKLEERIEILWNLIDITTNQKKSIEILFDNKVKVSWMTLLDMQYDYYLEMLKRHQNSNILPDTIFC